MLLGIKKNYNTLLQSFQFSVLFKPKTEAFKCESICILLFFPAINFFLNQILQTYFAFSSISYIFYLLMAVIGLLAYSAWFSKTPRSVVILSIAILLLAFFSFLIYPQISKVLLNKDLNPLTSALMGLFFYQIPALIYSSNITDWGLLLRRCLFYAITTVFLGVISFYFFTIQAASEDIPNYMVYLYNLLAGLGPMVVLTFMSRSVIKMGLLIIGFICLLIVGARGAQLSFVLVIIACAIYFAKNKLRALSALGIISLLFIIALNNLDVISGWMDTLLGDYGAHSRTLTKLIEGDFFSQSGRDKLRDIIYVGINQNPFGYGLFGDRYLTAVGGWGEPAYCHNIFLELCCDFGIIIGPILFISICYKIIKNCNTNRQHNKRNFLLLLLPCGFFELFFSNSLILSIPFFAMIGVLLNNSRIYLHK